jgi:transposase
MNANAWIAGAWDRKLDRDLDRYNAEGDSLERRAEWVDKRIEEDINGRIEADGIGAYVSIDGEVQRHLTLIFRGSKNIDGLIAAIDNEIRQYCRTYLEEQFDKDERDKDERDNDDANFGD